MKEDDGKKIPPYVSYKTFTNFVEGLKNAMPGRIDRSVMSSLSGAVQSQLASSLDYFELITGSGRPTEKLARLVNWEGAQRKHLLREMLASAYAFLFKNLDMQNATTRQLQEEFSRVGASGDTVRKCINFFLAAARDSELQLSPYFKKTRLSRGSYRVRRAGFAEAQQANEGTLNQTPSAPWSQLLLSKFPSFDLSWPDEVKLKWFDDFQKLMFFLDKKEGDKN